jgi:putative tryptophan/tyrosine transport system substrate-binding protein
MAKDTTGSIFVAAGLEAGALAWARTGPADVRINARTTRTAISRTMRLLQGVGLDAWFNDAPRIAARQAGLEARVTSLPFVFKRPSAHIDRRRFLLSSLAGALAQPRAAGAQQPGRVARIGFLGATTAAGYARQIEALQSGLRDLGYAEGKNIHIEYRWAEGRYDRLPDLARELVLLGVDLIVTHGVPGTSAAKRTTKTVPIVMAIVGDAVAFGLVTNVARPGGNLTGLTFFGPEIMGKRLELLKEAFPNSSRVAVFVNPDNRAMGPVLTEMAARAKALGVALQPAEARRPSEFAQAFAAIAKEGSEAVVIVEDGVFIAHIQQIADVAARHRLPAIGSKEYTYAGGLMAYAVDVPRIWRQSATFVDKILRGANPGDLPIEQATHFEFVVNLKTAKTLGLTLPPSLLARADQIIE